MVICLELVVDLHMAQLMPLPLTVSCLSKIQIGFVFLLPAHPGSPGKRAVKRVCVCVCVCVVLCFASELSRFSNGVKCLHSVCDWWQLGLVSCVQRAAGCATQFSTKPLSSAAFQRRHV